MRKPDVLAAYVMGKLKKEEGQVLVHLAFAK
jgi:hypothetical protein